MIVFLLFVIKYEFLAKIIMSINKINLHIFIKKINNTNKEVCYE